MSTFRDEDWVTREATLGDPAEQAFVRWAVDAELGHVKFGLDRPPVDLRKIPPFVRYTPDFLTDQGMVEVQGCGRDQTFKFKHDKLEALRDWNRYVPVFVWLWNQPMDFCTTIDIVALARMCYSRGGYRTDGLFDGSKPFSSVTWEQLGGLASVRESAG